MITIRWLERNELPVDAINNLLVQQSASRTAESLSEPELQECLENKNFHVAIAVDTTRRYPEDIIGMATIFFQRNPGKWIAEIHDVVVDQNYRGQGIGRNITSALIEKAKDFARLKVKTVSLSLTSRPSRVVANQMYQGMGFEQIANSHGPDGTNLYRMVVNSQ